MFENFGIHMEHAFVTVTGEYLMLWDFFPEIRKPLFERSGAVSGVSEMTTKDQGKRSRIVEAL